MSVYIYPAGAPADAPSLNLAEGNFEILLKVLGLPAGSHPPAAVRAAMKRRTVAQTEGILRQQSVTRLDLIDVSDYLDELLRVVVHAEAVGAPVVLGTP